MDWSLYRCGRSGHITYAPDEPHLREHLHCSSASLELWQCLRCGSFIAGQPHGAGPAGDAPPVKRGKQIRGDLILKLFAIERAIRFVIFGAVAFGIWRFAGAHVTVAQAIKRDVPIIRTLVKQLGFNLNHALLDKIQSLLHVSSSNLHLLAFGVAGLAVVSAIEAFALWQAKRWGEYFALIVTSLGLPFEIYELTKAVTVTKLVLFALNLLLVAYLVYSRRLFGARGGKEAYEARLRADSVLDEAEKAAAAIRAALAAGPAAAATYAASGTAAASRPLGSGPPGSIPPGSVPPGSVPPGSVPPESIPPGSPASPTLFADRATPAGEPATIRRETSGPA